MKKIIPITFSLVLTGLWSLNILAQEKQTIDPGKMVNWTINEKLKFTPQQIMQAVYFKNQMINVNNTTGLKTVNNSKGTDYPVSNVTNSEAEISAAINPTDSNNVVVSPIAIDNSGYIASLSCPIYYTKDFGSTWSKSSFTNMPSVSGATTLGGGDPVFAYDANGKLYFTWIDLYMVGTNYTSCPMGIFWAYSTDGGVTWQKEQDNTILLGALNPMNSQIIQPISDKQWIAVDRTNSSYKNTAYISYVLISGNQDATYKIMCSRKSADSANFIKPATQVTPDSTFGFVQFASIDVDNQGNVHVIFFGTKDNINMALWHSVSTDGAHTFSVPNKISDMRFNMPAIFKPLGQPYDSITGINTSRLYPCPYIAADKTNGNIYVTWTAFGINSDAGNGADIYFSRSADNGSSWSVPAIVNNNNPGSIIHQYYPSICTSNSGNIYISWYDRRDDTTNNIQTHYYVAESSDGGLTFDNNKITSIPTDFSTVCSATTNSNFGIGEYNQILSTTGYIIPVWTDGRKNNGDLDVYTAIIPRGHVGIKEVRTVSENFSLGDIFPNPVKTTAEINFNLKKSSHVTLFVIDINGALVRTLTDNEYQAGEHTLTLSTVNMAGGKYFYFLKTDFGNAVKTFEIVR